MKLFENTNGHDIPEMLPVVPTVDVVAFPNMIVPLLIVDEKIIEGINQSINAGNKLVVIVACKKETSANKSISAQDLYSVGTVVNIMRVIPLSEGGVKILIQSIARIKILEIKVTNMLIAKISPIKYDSEIESQEEIQEQISSIKVLAESLAKSGEINSNFSSILSKMTQPDKIIDFLLSHLTLNTSELQKLLEVNSYSEFFNIVYNFLAREAEILKINNNIKHKARESMSSAQKEFYIREQIRALKEEIGDEAGFIDIFRSQLKEIEEFLNDETQKEIVKSINRLEGMQSESAEASVLRTYLEYIFDLPWGIETIDNNDIVMAKMILDEEHYGLQSIKERILDFLSVRILSKKQSSQILCFYGPPGTGKTSLAKSIANALGRKYIRISVGGMKDEAEIRGHRRTYVGAIPGRFIKGIKQVQSKNPVIVIDEVDKIGQEFKGDPASALLEVLDYQQNSTFYDYYLGVPFDLSKAFFICTANNIENIPGPLLDRMELIQLTSYSFEEKRSIAKKYLIRRAIEETGLNGNNIDFSDEVIEKIIESYTHEAGIRDLDRWIKKMCARIARIFIEKGQIEEVTPENLDKYIGPARFIKTNNTKVNKIGVSQGLCWTSCGGETINIETVVSQGTGKFILTGQLGDVMKESAHAAMSYIKSNSHKFDIDEKIYNSYDIHLHVPAGGIPKDGPSAGAAILGSLLSAILKKHINHEYAMTGEIDLQGNILPIGGVKEKIIAAKRNGIKKVLIPEKNKFDVFEITDLIDGVEVIYISRIEEVIKLLLGIDIPIEIEHQNIHESGIEKQIENLIESVVAKKQD